MNTTAHPRRSTRVGVASLPFEHCPREGSAFFFNALDSQRLTNHQLGFCIKTHELGPKPLWRDMGHPSKSTHERPVTNGDELNVNGRLKIGRCSTRNEKPPFRQVGDVVELVPQNRRRLMLNEEAHRKSI